MIGLYCRMRKLERQIKEIQIKENCASGRHEWVVIGGRASYDPPRVVCKHCCASPSPEKQQ